MMLQRKGVCLGLLVSYKSTVKVNSHGTEMLQVLPFVQVKSAAEYSSRQVDEILHFLICSMSVLLRKEHGFFCIVLFFSLTSMEVKKSAMKSASSNTDSAVDYLLIRNKICKCGFQNH